MSYLFMKKPVQSQRPRAVDRFIPLRESFADERRRGSWRYESPEQTIEIWTPELQKQKNYKKYLDEVFGMKSFQPVVENRTPDPEDAAYLQPWPCAPRKKRYLHSVDSILALPSYSNSTLPKVIDWSKNNMLVVACGSNYHMFNGTSQKAENREGGALSHVASCKFNPRGDLILLGCQSKIVELHDAKQSKLVINSNCNCTDGSMYKTCDITAIDWSPSGNSFITGCSRGNVVSFDQQTLRVNSSCCPTQYPIRSVKISPNTKYVAVLCQKSKEVFLLEWPSLETLKPVSLYKYWFVKTICWHPWRSALLGILTQSSHLPHLLTCINMVDVPCRVTRSYCLDQFYGYSLDLMLFFHNTGELVLSLWNSGQESSSDVNGAKLLVMSDPENVVDYSWYGLGDRVRTMVFSRDGTKLATADESLMIWNFLPQEKKKIKARSRKPVLTDALSMDCVVLR